MRCMFRLSPSLYNFARKYGFFKDPYFRNWKAKTLTFVEHLIVQGRWNYTSIQQREDIISRVSLAPVCSKAAQIVGEKRHTGIWEVSCCIPAVEGPLHRSTRKKKAGVAARGAAAWVNGVKRRGKSYCTAEQSEADSCNGADNVAGLWMFKGRENYSFEMDEKLHLSSLPVMHFIHFIPASQHAYFSSMQIFFLHSEICEHITISL